MFSINKGKPFEIHDIPPTVIFLYTSASLQMPNYLKFEL